MGATKWTSCSFWPPPRGENAHFLSFRRLTLAAERQVRVATGGEEHVMDVLSGICDIEIEEGRRTVDRFTGVGGRRDIFSGNPEFVYIPRDRTYVVRCVRAPFEAAIYSAPTEESGTPVHVRADQVRVLASGVSDWRRNVYIGMGDDGPATTMLVGETESPPGNWSGFPPHRHSEHRPPAELSLEELYYLKFAPANGFAIGASYQDLSDRAGTASLSMVYDSQLFDVPAGYHFIAPCPGYRLRYTWALGGEQRKFGAWVADPDYAWLANYKEE